MHVASTYSTHTDLPGSMHSEDVDTTPDLRSWGSWWRGWEKDAGRDGTHEMRTSFSLSEITCASSVGGPGLNFGEQMAGRSRLGTGWTRSR